MKDSTGHNGSPKAAAKPDDGGGIKPEPAYGRARTILSNFWKGAGLNPAKFRAIQQKAN